ncbi:MAG: hypothetical protein ACTHME_06955 [Candidatus Nitrosocosmicus sp.]
MALDEDVSVTHILPSLRVPEGQVQVGGIYPPPPEHTGSIAEAL